MLYKIKNNYYIRVGRKYVKVDLKVDNDDVNIIPINGDFLEESGNLNITEQLFTDEFKKSIIDSNKKDIFNNKIENNSKTNKYHKFGKHN